MTTITIPRRHGTVIKAHRSRVAQWLREHPGRQNKREAADACNVPQGTRAHVFSDSAFICYEGGSVELRSGRDRQIITRPEKYGTALLLNVRQTVFTELTVKSPQTVSALAAELKLAPELIAEALQWKRFCKVHGGWVIGAKGEIESLPSPGSIR